MKSSSSTEERAAGHPSQPPRPASTDRLHTPPTLSPLPSRKTNYNHSPNTRETVNDGRHRRRPSPASRAALLAASLGCSRARSLICSFCSLPPPLLLLPLVPASHRRPTFLAVLIPSPGSPTLTRTQVDAWIAQLQQCKTLSEADIKRLCEKVRSLAGSLFFDPSSGLHLRFFALALG